MRRLGSNDPIGAQGGEWRRIAPQALDPHSLTNHRSKRTSVGLSWRGGKATFVADHFAVPNAHPRCTNDSNSVAAMSNSDASDHLDDSTALSEAQAALEDARKRIAEVPAQVVVVNHLMGLYELAAIHLSSVPPKLDDASLAIDALAALVDKLGDRLGDETATMRDALANIQVVFVQMTSRG